MAVNNATVNFVEISRAKFNALTTTDENTFYVVKETDNTKKLYQGSTVLTPTPDEKWVLQKEINGVFTDDYGTFSDFGEGLTNGDTYLITLSFKESLYYGIPYSFCYILECFTGEDTEEELTYKNAFSFDVLIEKGSGLMRFPAIWNSNDDNDLRIYNNGEEGFKDELFQNPVIQIYKKVVRTTQEISKVIGDIESALDTILGV